MSYAERLPAEGTPAMGCERCGRYTNAVDARALGVSLGGRQTVSRRLCLRCTDIVLEAITAALRPARGGARRL